MLPRLQLLFLLVAGLCFLIGLTLVRYLPGMWCAYKDTDRWPLGLIALAIAMCWGITGWLCWVLAKEWIAAGKLPWLTMGL